MERLKNIEALRNLRALLVRDVYGPGKNVVKVCCGLPCSALGSHKVAAALEDEASASGINVNVVKTGCQGLCQKGPLVRIEPYGYFYRRVYPEHAADIIGTTFQSGMPVRELLYRDSFLDEPAELLQQHFNQGCL